MRRLFKLAVLVLLLGLLFTGVAPGPVMADGDETLGAPVGITLASGSGILAAGTGLITQPGTINIDIPSGVTIEQVLLYWQGLRNADDTIQVDGNVISGSLIGTGGNRSNRFCYRADVTALGLLSPGSNTLNVNGLNFGVNNGAGVLVIVDDGVNTADIDLRDGDDFAFSRLSSPYNTTVAQTFTFTPDNVDRTATLNMFFASVSGAVSGGGFRPSAIEVTVQGNKTVYNDYLDSVDGDEWDTVNLSVNIPAGASSLKVQALSVDNPGGQTGTPASFDWLAAALSVPNPPSGGGEGCTPGYWKQPHHFDSWEGYEPYYRFSAVFGRTITINIGTKKAPVSIQDPTLLQALKARGGGLNALLRHTVAALLNAASTDVDYDLSESKVIAEFNAVYPGTKSEYNQLKNFFAGLNEQGCPLN